MQTQLPLMKKIVRFCVSGAAGVVGYGVVLYGLTEYCGVWYVLSAVCGFFVNTGINFVLQKTWTFQNRDQGAVGRQLVLYFLMFVSFLVGNTVSLYLMVERLHMWYIEAQLIITIIISILSFIISGKIFRCRTKRSAS